MRFERSNELSVCFSLFWKVYRVWNVLKSSVLKKEMRV